MPIPYLRTVFVAERGFVMDIFTLAWSENKA